MPVCDQVVQRMAVGVAWDVKGGAAELERAIAESADPRGDDEVAVVPHVSAVLNQQLEPSMVKEVSRPPSSVPNSARQPSISIVRLLLTAPSTPPSTVSTVPVTIRDADVAM